MADPAVLTVVDGEFALALVDPDAVGYTDAWQAPGGATAESVLIAAYTGASAWHCQVMDGNIVPTANITKKKRDATFCGPSRTTPVVGESSYTLNAKTFQDVHVSTGLSKFLFLNDAKEAYFLLGLNGGDPPRAIGRVFLTSGAFGGKAEEDLKDTLKLELARKPSIAFGDETTSVIVGSVAAPEMAGASKSKSKSKAAASKDG